MANPNKPVQSKKVPKPVKQVRPREIEAKIERAKAWLKPRTNRGPRAS